MKKTDSFQQKYNKPLKEIINKTYRKSSARLEKAINVEAKQIAKNINIDKRVECSTKVPAFIKKTTKRILCSAIHAI